MERMRIAIASPSPTGTNMLTIILFAAAIAISPIFFTSSAAEKHSHSILTGHER